MSSPPSRLSFNSSRPPAFPLTPNEVAAQIGRMRIDATPSTERDVRVPMPEPRIWSPPNIFNDNKPLPSLPPKFNPPPLPPRIRPPHIADRPNPYDLLPPLPTPPGRLPIPIPTPNPSSTNWDERPPLSPHAYSDPPPALRPGYTPTPPPPPIPFLTPPSTPFLHHSPANRPRLSIPTRLSSPPVPTSSDLLVPPSPSRARASSVPLSPSASRAYDGAVQCSGVTKTGKRCTRAVKSPHPYTQATPAQDGDIEVNFKYTLAPLVELMMYYCFDSSASVTSILRTFSSRRDSIQGQ